VIGPFNWSRVDELVELLILIILIIITDGCSCRLNSQLDFKDSAPLCFLLSASQRFLF